METETISLPFESGPIAYRDLPYDEDVPAEFDEAGNLIYPDDDGRLMSNNTEHDQWMAYLFDGLADLFKDDEDIFVARDHLWYPVENNLKLRVAPDVMVAFGVPKGHRGSYKQWVEGVAPQVVFEVLSPGNTRKEMKQKLRFFDTFGVEEYYIYDCKKNDLKIWVRPNIGSSLKLIPSEDTEGWKSPRLSVRFWFLKSEGLCVELPTGKAIERYSEVMESRAEIQAEREKAESEREKAELEREKAQSEREKLAAKLRELGVDPNSL